MATINIGRAVGAGTAINISGGLGLRWPASPAVVVALVGGGRLTMAPKLASCAAGVLALPGRRLSFRPVLRGVGAGTLTTASGPGESAGMAVGALPAVWQGINMPAGYLGPWLAMLALAGGSAWVLDGSKLTIAGRVVIDAAGGDINLATEAAARRWLAGRYALAADCVGVIALPAGDVRNAAVSKLRDAAYVAAKKNAKAVPKVADAARRLALVADLSFSLRAV